jgi:hypothetical protein
MRALSGGNLKIQIPKSKQAPISKIPNIQRRVGILRFEIWDLFGFWVLDFGACPVRA